MLCFPSIWLQDSKEYLKYNWIFGKIKLNCILIFSNSCIAILIDPKQATHIPVHVLGARDRISDRQVDRGSHIITVKFQLFFPVFWGFCVPRFTDLVMLAQFCLYICLQICSNTKLNLTFNMWSLLSSVLFGQALPDIINVEHIMTLTL